MWGRHGLPPLDTENDLGAYDEFIWQMPAKANNPYDKTMAACFVAYMVQFIVNNFAPPLFLTFQESFGVPLRR